MTIGDPDDVKADDGTYQMLKLPYKYDAMTPGMDEATMEIHYSKHYLTYTNNLNRLVAGNEEKLPIEDLIAKLDVSNADLRNNAGAYYNHNIFWESIGSKAPGVPTDTLAKAIKRDFTSFENFKVQFEDASSKQFGSGWVWLITDKSGKLQITSTQNQDNPLMSNALIKGTPILGIDLWEHAYYLHYQYKRKKYIDAFMKVINWKKVGEKYEDAIRKKY